MNSIKITNPVVYTVPDSDSDSDSETYYRPLKPLKHTLSEKQEQNLIKLGCHYNSLEEIRRLYNTVHNPNCFDQHYDKKFEQHLVQLKTDLDSILEKESKRNAEERKKYDALVSELKCLSVEDEKELDKEFEEELKKQRKAVQDAIAYDRKKFEEQSAEAKAKADKEKKDLEDAENKKKELAEKKELNAKLKKQQQSTATSAGGLKEFETYYARIEAYKKNIRPKLDDENFRKACFMKKKGVKRALSQLQNKHDVIVQKYKDIYQIVMTLKQESDDVYQITLNYIAKTFLDQVRQDVTAKPHSAYFLARFAYLLCSTIPEFLDYLMGRLYKRCQYLIPRFHDDDPTLSDDEIRKRLRYCNADKQFKVLESFIQHAEGHKSYVMFFGALCQTLPDPGQPENVFPIKHAWIYLARLCNMPPREITPFLILGLLEVSAQRLLQVYPNQMPKLLRLLKQTILPIMETESAGDNTSALSRLEIFLDSYFQRGEVLALSEVPP